MQTAGLPVANINFAVKNVNNWASKVKEMSNNLIMLG